jgi:hypothetical protein
LKVWKVAEQRAQDWQMGLAPLGATSEYAAPDGAFYMWRTNYKYVAPMALKFLRLMQKIFGVKSIGMNGNLEKSNQQSLFKIFWILLFAFAFIILLFAIFSANFVGDGGQKANAIINNLRYIDFAKSQWAFEHGITNADQAENFTQSLSWKDIAPYLLQNTNVLLQKHFGNDGVVHPVSGEIYKINSLSKPPEAKLIHDVQFLTKGTIIPDPDKLYIYLNQVTNN